MAVSLNTALGAFPITALAGTTYVPLAGGTMTGALTIASGTLTASAPGLNITQTWNANAAFTAAKINVTKTLSDGFGLLQDWQLGSVSMANIREDGVLTCGSVVAGAGYVNDLVIASSIILTTDAAATLAQRNGTNAQTLRVYGSYTDASNYERLSLSTTAGTGVTIAAETLGTGSDNLSLTLASSGTGHVIFSAPNITIQNNVGLRNGDSVGTGRLYLDVSNVVFRRGDGASLPGMWKFGGETSSFAALRGSSTTIQSRLADDSGYGSLESLNLGQTGYHQMTEMTAPSAPAANSVRIYAEDNGSGKTRLMALFATGAAQQISIEP